MKYVSLYSGCGGVDIGFHHHGFSNVGAFDINETALKVLSKNLCVPTHLADLSVADVPRKLGINEVEVVFSGAPCQGFSTAGKRVYSDPRNNLLVRGAEIALQLNCAVFVSENVMGSLSGNLKQYWDRVELQFRAAGYRTQFVRVNCLDIGMAQMRKRVLFFAWKGPTESISWDQNKPQKKLRDVLANLDSLPNIDEYESVVSNERKIIANAIAPYQKLSNVRGGPRAVPSWEIPDVFGYVSDIERQILIYIRSTRRKFRKREFGDADPVDIELINAKYGLESQQHLSRLIEKGYLIKKGPTSVDLTRTFNGKYRRLSFDEPCPTVDTRFGNPTYFLHPIENRGFSVRETARIQGFPDTFVFEGSLEEKYRMIGNAVPPPLSKIVAKIVKEQLLR